MRYFSTRNKNIRVSSAQAIAQGLSRDGGLFVPNQIPKLTRDDISLLVAMDYPRRAAFILAKFLDDFSEDELYEYAKKAYNTQTFDTEAIAPIHKLDEQRFMLELWHGPTSAFKDMALQILPYLLTTSLKKTYEYKEVCILVATSGDTGKAALDGFRDVEGTKIAVFFPKDGVSKIQELQMTTQEGGNVFVGSVYGNFDTVQSTMKEIFSSEELRAKAAREGYFFSSANSINWGRAVPQIVYYISAYCDMVKSGEIFIGDSVNVCVPTGNFGNILAAYYAREMGINIKTLICASNHNNVLTDFFNNKVYDKRREFLVSRSPAMDILISSNLERLLFALSDQDDQMTSDLMNQLNKEGVYQVNEKIAARLDELFYADFATEQETLATIRKTFDEKNYLIDTHTAVGVSVYEKYAEKTGDNTKTIIASTASPFKFADSVLFALDIPYEYDGLELLGLLNAATGEEIPTPLADLEGKAVRFNVALNKDEIADLVLAFLKNK